MKSFLPFTFLDSTIASGDAEMKHVLVGEHRRAGMAAGFAEREV